MSKENGLSVHIQPVTSPAENQLFLDVPARVYANNPYWVSPLLSDVAKQFAPSNPFFEYGKLQQFIALKNNTKKPEAVGRIVAAVNQRLIDKEAEKVGLFGFLNALMIWRLPKLYLIPLLGGCESKV